MQRVGLEPLDPYPGTGKPWRSKCLVCRAEVFPRLNSIRSGNGGCRHCAAKRRGEQQLADGAARAEADMVGAGLRPLDPYPGADKPWRSECLTCGKEVAPRVGDIRSRGGGCEFCAGKARIPDDEAERQMRAAGYEPLEKYPGVREPWRCRCAKCDRVGSPSLNSVKAGKGCNFCKYDRFSEERRRPHDEAAELIRGFALEPLEPYPGALKKWSCECTRCGDEVSPQLGPLLHSGGTGCRRCGREKQKQSVRFSEEEATAYAEASGLEPLEEYVNANTPWRCRCLRCDREVKPRLTSLQAGGACKWCADRGIDLDAPGVVYVIHHPAHGAFKVGIMRQGSNRLSNHAFHGWAEVGLTETETVADALVVERMVLGEYRRSGACPFLEREQMPVAGYTETIDATAVDAKALIEHVRSASELVQSV